MVRRKTAYHIGRVGPAAARDAALERDGYRCRYCGVLTQQGVDRTVDHVIPAWMGGKSTVFNLVTACEPCNIHKGRKSLREAGMRILPRPKFDPTTIGEWQDVINRKCCIHCGLSIRSHRRDSSQSHGKQMRCVDIDKQFLPRDLPLGVYERLGVDRVADLVLS